MLKVGKANLIKAEGFQRDRNWVQTLRYGELAATKLKQLKDRRLETVQAIDHALACKFNALTFTNRHREAMECAEERYTLWAMNHLRNPGSMLAALELIQSCIHNKEYEDAERYARHAMFMINDMTDSFIPSDQQPRFLADVSFWLAMAILHLAEAGGIPPAEKQKAGEEAITLARQALELHSQLFGAESAQVASDMGILANVLDQFNNVDDDDDDDDEIFRLYERSNAIFSIVEGSSSPNVAVGRGQLGIAHVNRARRARAVNDMDRCLTNYTLALTHLNEAARICRANHHVDKADTALGNVAQVEEEIRQIRTAMSSSTAAPATRG